MVPPEIDNPQHRHKKDEDDQNSNHLHCLLELQRCDTGHAGIAAAKACIGRPSVYQFHSYTSIVNIETHRGGSPDINRWVKEQWGGFIFSAISVFFC